MVSEYAIGNHNWALTLMFLGWATSSWALAFSLWPRVDVTGKFGAVLLFISGFGAAMGGAFDVLHPLHGIAVLLGVPTVPVAALLFTISLWKTSDGKSDHTILILATLMTLLSFILMAIAMVLFIKSFTAAGGVLGGKPVDILPEGVFAYHG